MALAGPTRHDPPVDAVRRDDDDELCGFVEQRGSEWLAFVVFGAELGRHATRDDAIARVLSDGLASLAERWTLQRGDGSSEEVVCVVEANADWVTVALGYYSLPGVPTLTIRASEIAAGEWKMFR